VVWYHTVGSGGTWFFIMNSRKAEWSAKIQEHSNNKTTATSREQILCTTRIGVLLL